MGSSAYINKDNQIMKNKQANETVEIQPGVFEPLEARNLMENGDNAEFFHSLGRAIGGAKVDNKYLKTHHSEGDKSR